jgi:hypothetical protein
MTKIDLPIATLIERRRRELGLRRSEVAARCGYKNLSKGLRRLEQVLSGDLERADTLLRALPNALNLPPDVVQGAINKTVHQIAAEKEAIWRASFQPSAYLLGTTDRPSQILFFRNYGRPGEVAKDSARPFATACELCRASPRRGA